MKVDDKVTVIERTYTNELFEWDGVITQVNESFIETKHCRNETTHPQWSGIKNAYCDTWTKHYFHPDGVLINIK